MSDKYNKLKSSITEMPNISNEDKSQAGGTPKFLGLTMVLGGLIGSGYLYYEYKGGLISALTFQIICYILVYAGAVIAQYGRKLEAKTIEQTLALYKKQPILLLRPFAIDSDPEFDFIPFSIIPNLQQTFSIEQQIQQATCHLGPLIAIGDPKDMLPTIGAARTYFQNMEWFDKAKDYMNIAQIIIVVWGGDSGIQRELSEIFEMEDLTRVIIYLPIIKESSKKINPKMDSAEKIQYLGFFWRIILALFYFPSDIKERIYNQLGENNASQYLYFKGREPFFFSPYYDYYGRRDGVRAEFSALLKELKFKAEAKKDDF